MQVALLGDIFDLVQARWPDAPLRAWEKRLIVFEEMKPKNIPPLMEPLAKNLATVCDGAGALGFIKTIDKKVWKHCRNDPDQEVFDAVFVAVKAFVAVTENKPSEENC